MGDDRPNSNWFYNQAMESTGDVLLDQRKKHVTIYCDGACSGNPGPGGWGAILIYKQVSKEISGFEKLTTNNRMEMTACLEALKALNETCVVDIYTDSAYLFNAYDKNWLRSWIAKGWRKSDNKPVENQDLWQQLLEMTDKHEVRFHKVKGHSDNELNNRADKLATQAIKLAETQNA